MTDQKKHYRFTSLLSTVKTLSPTSTQTESLPL